MKNPIFVALDVDDKKTALRIANEVSESVGGFKIGPRLCIKYGESLISELAELGPVFVDNKYYDIPTTVESALRATFNAGASYATVHGSMGYEGLKGIAALERELSQHRPFKVLAVTVLTSYDAGNLPPQWIDQPISDHVFALAESVVEAGLSGLVCSGEEVADLRKVYPKAFLVTPGIRLPEGDHGDQKRVLTPEQAIARGATALVVGRPIIKASHPHKAAKVFCERLGL